MLLPEGFRGADTVLLDINMPAVDHTTWHGR
jgi:hypothetical protein